MHIGILLHIFQNYHVARYGISLIRKPRCLSVCCMRETSSSSINIVPKENTSSPIWTYFGLKSDDEGKPISNDKVICRVCCGSVTAKGGNTSNLFSHLKGHHPKSIKK